MRLWLRLFIVRLLALTLPLQGMAAATRLHCGPAPAGGHEHPAAHRGQAASAHVSHDHGAPGHGHGAEMNAHTTAAATGDNSAPAQHASAKCSACAACCAAALLPVALPTPPLLKPGTEAIPFTDDACPAVVASGPERPPRNFLA